MVPVRTEKYLWQARQRWLSEILLFGRQILWPSLCLTVEFLRRRAGDTEES